jgi:hypothetical protein
LLVSTDKRRRRIHSGLRRADPFEEKALEPPRVEVLTDVDVAPAVDGNRVRHIQRSTKETLLPESREYLPRLLVARASRGHA